MAYYLNNLNKKQEISRVAAGRMADVKDMSIMSLQAAKEYREQLGQVMKAKGANSSELNKDAFADLTDLQNPDFHFVRVIRRCSDPNCKLIPLRHNR
ncbi:hypothetical protein QFC19_005160 [Naganishia cerealis]|uniref:Uncharacterized protein n=1 Tax=Naganishia cerealis TaxID=610337 RepID=A0ACC2VSS6_9TREE|nr:hypothetical protein QFC19_005160 [Naganishia cerealis]